MITVSDFVALAALHLVFGGRVIIGQQLRIASSNAGIVTTGMLAARLDRWRLVTVQRLIWRCQPGEYTFITGF